MHRDAVESSNVVSKGYDGLTGDLEVEFRSGTVGRYVGVPASVSAAFDAAESKGEFVNRVLKPGYEFRKESKGESW